MTDPATVADQYATSERLRTRMAVWRPGPDGVSPLREVRRVLRPGGTLVAVTNGAAHLAALPGQFRPRPGGRSPTFDGPREYAGFTTVFMAT